MACNSDIKRLKDNLTLDFNQSPSQTKKLFQKSSNILLTTPDVDKFKLSTPEVAKLLEKIPSVGPLPTFTRMADEDEEKPSKQALEFWGKNIANMNDNKFRKENEDNNNSNSASFSGDSSIQLPRINMEDQELAKLERKRLRNRIAASKCRQRKLERISRLQAIKNKRLAKLDELTKWIDVLCEVNKILADRILEHKELGCDLG